jgi:hypothetical protein
MLGTLPADIGGNSYRRIWMHLASLLGKRLVLGERDILGGRDILGERDVLGWRHVLG